MAVIIDTQYIKALATTIVDAKLLQLREDVYGPGVTFAPFIPLSSLPPTVIAGDLDQLVGDYGYIKHIEVYSGGVFKGDVTELDFLNASVLVTGNRASITISGRGIIDAGVNNNTPYSNVGHLNFTVAGGSLMSLSSSYDSGTNKATIVFDISAHQVFKATYTELGHVTAGSGLLIVDGQLRIDPAVIPSGFVNPMTSIGDIVYGGTLGTPLRRGIGSELQVLTVSGGVPTWQSAQTVIGSGVAPTNAKYIVAEAHAGLSNEIIIPGLAGSADIQGTYGGGTEYEFDSGASPFTWSHTPDTEDVNTTIKSHLFIQHPSTAGTPAYLAWTSWTPPGDFVISAKVSGVAANHTFGNSIGLQLYNSDNSQRLMIYLIGTGSEFRVDSFSYNGGSYTELAGGVRFSGPSYRYLRISRTGSTFSFFQSYDGLLWQFMNTSALGITVSRMGLFMSSGDTTSTNKIHGAVDWIRANV